LLLLPPPLCILRDCACCGAHIWISGIAVQ
jgi:hypothetical protein